MPLRRVRNFSFKFHSSYPMCEISATKDKRLLFALLKMLVLVNAVVTLWSSKPHPPVCVRRPRPRLCLRKLTHVLDLLRFAAVSLLLFARAHRSVPLGRVEDALREYRGAQ